MLLIITTTAINWDWSTEKPAAIDVTNVCTTCGPRSNSLIASSTPDGRELITLQTELETTKTELERAKSRIESLTKALHHHIPTNQ